jgi:iron-sulfur cluster insertion protein
MADMSNPTSNMTFDDSSSPLRFTDSAAHKVYELIQDEGNPALKLRVFITGGGCSGFQYGFSFDEQINPDDMIIEKKLHVSSDSEGEEDEGGNGSPSSVTVMLLIDSMSFQYLANAEIDYREDVNGAQFVIRNPNAKTTCGCGSSFSA